jgi:hypothetical protein
VSRTHALRRLPLAGAAPLLLALALGACGGSTPSGTATASSGPIADVSAAPAAPPADATTEPPAAADPAATPATTSAPAAKAPPTTAARTTTPSTPTTVAAAAAPPTTAAPVTPKFAPGQRITPTSAQLQAAVAALHQRIPLFQPTEAQLRTFADAACASFDQGQNASQVSATVRQAVTYVQGASLTVADADFTVQTVVTLRCPGYLP